MVALNKYCANIFHMHCLCLHNLIANSSPKVPLNTFHCSSNRNPFYAPLFSVMFNPLFGDRTPLGLLGEGSWFFVYNQVSFDRFPRRTLGLCSLTKGACRYSGAVG